MYKLATVTLNLYFKAIDLLEKLKKSSLDSIFNRIHENTINTNDAFFFRIH